MGVRQTNSFLEKATWTLVSCLVVLSVISAFTMPKAGAGTELRTRPVQAPAAATAPAGQFDTPAVEVTETETVEVEEPAAPAEAQAE